MGDDITDEPVTLADPRHIGSTSVPLRGKPIIDIQLALVPSAHAGALRELARLGYVHHGEAGIPGRQYLTRRQPAGTAVNVHVFAPGDARLAENRQLRDHLKADPRAAAAYVEAKEQALADGHDRLRAYSRAKAGQVAALQAAVRASRAALTAPHRGGPAANIFAMALPPDVEPPPGWLPTEDFHAIYRRVPRLCVEVILSTPQRGIVLALRDIPPNEGAWHIPGGTVLFGESLKDAVRRVARYELGLEVAVGELLGTIEYPSHYLNGLDSPVGLAYACTAVGGEPALDGLPDGCAWFERLPDGLYEEQRAFLSARLGYS